MNRQFQDRPPKRRRPGKHRPRAVTNKAWEQFVEWCQSRGLNPVPANPWTVAAFARWSESTHRPAAIRKLVAGIAQIHEGKTRKRLERHPLVERTLAMIDAKAEAAKSSSKLFEDDDFLDDEKPKANRKAAKPKVQKTLATKRKASGPGGLSAQPRLVSRRKLKR